jgi:putative heme-binding domain-containing protein
MLRYLKQGWTVDQRRIVFDALRKAEGLNGASTYFKVLQDTRSELAAALTPAEATQLAAVIHPPQPAKLLPTALPGHSYRDWKLADLEPQLAKVKSGRSFETAKSAMVTAQCVFCHKVSNDPTLPAGIAGPDLTQVRSRFSARDLLMHILEPSVVVEEKFRILTLTKADGTEVSGTLESEDDERVTLRPNLLSPEVIEVGKSSIKTRRTSEISPMPPGLLSPLKQEAILDLLAWFEANGDPASPVWKR